MDATFNICNYVTITTYKHHLLYDTKSNRSPVILGAALIHSHRTHDSYYTLTSNICRFSKWLKKIFVVGSDCEPALYKPFLECFPNADHLLCTIHMKYDINSACKGLNLQSESKNLIRDIFGVRDGDAKIKGLIDAETDAEFDAVYSTRKDKWLNITNGKKLLKYIEEHKKDKLRKNMGADVHTRSGLGNTPVEYTRNANESVNSIVKRAKEKNILTLKDAIKLIQQEVNNQLDKIKLAQIGKGEWRVKQEFLSGKKAS